PPWQRPVVQSPRAAADLRVDVLRSSLSTPVRLVRRLLDRASIRTDELRLTRRLAVYAATALVAAASCLFLFVRDDAIHHVKEMAQSHAQFIAASILHEHLRPEDLRSPVTGRRLHELDQLFTSE